MVLDQSQIGREIYWLQNVEDTQRTYQLAVGVNGVEELNVGLPLKHEVPDVLVLYFGEGRFSCVKLKMKQR